MHQRTRKTEAKAQVGRNKRSVVLPHGQSSLFINMLCTLQVVTLLVVPGLRWSITNFFFFPLKVNPSDCLLKKKQSLPWSEKQMNLRHAKVCLFCPLTTLSPAHCNIRPTIVRKQKSSLWIRWQSGVHGPACKQLPQTQQPAWIQSLLPTAGHSILVSSILLLVFSEPETWHPNYLWKRALKLACINQQKCVGEDGQCHCCRSLLFFCNQTTWWRQALHFNYLTTHLHVSCAAENMLSLSHMSQSCFEAALTRAKKWNTCFFQTSSSIFKGQLTWYSGPAPNLKHGSTFGN